MIASLMAQPRLLTNPPIKEAIFAVCTRPRLEGDILSHVPRSIIDRFPGRRSGHRIEAKLGTLEPETQEQRIRRDIERELFESKQKTRTVLISRDGISLSALRGDYPSWDVVLEEFRRLWEEYVEATHPELIWRISTRFINELLVPIDMDLDDFLTIGPRVPPLLPNQVSAFETRTAIPVDEYTVAVTLISHGFVVDDKLRITLDVDVWKDIELAPSNDQLWDTFVRLRELKNGGFFGSLTETALELYR